jgi:hypothetical protein
MLPLKMVNANSRVNFNVSSENVVSRFDGILLRADGGYVCCVSSHLLQQSLIPFFKESTLASIHHKFIDVVTFKNVLVIVVVVKLLYDLI